MNAPRSVLILEAHARAAVEAIRSFLRLGVRVVAASDKRLYAGRFVRGMQRRVQYPSVVHAPEAFVAWLLKYLATHPTTALFPLGDACVELIARNQEAIRRHTRLFMPPYERFETAFDKILTNKAAAAAGVPIPRCWYPDEEGLDAPIKAARFPVVVKPAVGVGARGIVRADTAQELEQVWSAALAGPCRSFVQEFVPLGGRQYVVDALLDESGRTVAAVASQKVRFFPPRGGASTLSRSVPPGDLCRVSEKLLQAIGYYGIANVDLIEDTRDGVNGVLEINPRFGEMHAICRVAGVDMIRLYWQLAMGEPAEPTRTYQTDRYLRFLPTDLMWFLASPDRFGAKPSFLECFGSQVENVLSAQGDYGPSLGYLLENLALLADPKALAYRFVREKRH
ncbi:MAG: ATP-grasp domain-containing protein [Planctomycetota bacterium]|nr:ATP-grasp domain-containing protein [Planctomycetota bacterium]